MEVSKNVSLSLVNEIEVEFDCGACRDTGYYWYDPFVGILPEHPNQDDEPHGDDPYLVEFKCNFCNLHANKKQSM